MTTLQQAPPITSIRCSKLDSIWACTPSVLSNEPGLIRISHTHEAAEIGQAVHELAANMVDGKEINIPKTCMFHEVEEDDVSTLFGYAERAWGELKRFFEQPQTESIVKSGVLDVGGKQFQIQGTGDIISPVGASNAIFLDWKTGFLDDSYHQQMAGYAYCIWCEMGRPDDAVITGIVAFLRHRYYRVVKYDADKLKQWEYDLIHNKLPAIDTYRPGKTCRNCELYAKCPARNAMVGSTLQTLMYPNSAVASDPTATVLAEAQKMLAGISVDNRDDKVIGETLDELLVKIKLAEQQIDHAKQLVRSAVQKVGYIPMPGGMALALRRVEIAKPDPMRAIKVLRTLLSEKNILEAMTLSLPKLLAARRGAAVKGEKGLAAAALREALEKENALNITIQERLEEIDLTQAIQEQEKKDAPPGSTSP